MAVSVKREPIMSSTAGADASAMLARVAAELTFEDLPEDVVTAAKWGILDTLGVSLAATGTPSASEYLNPIKQFFDAESSSGNVPAPTLGKRLSMFDAILWLGALSHSLDYDDVAGYSHPSAPAVSAALPVAHSIGRVDGKRLIAAVALGQDMTIRLAQALRRPVSDHGWLTSFPGVLAAAVTTAKLLDLDTEQTRNSLGLALHQTSGTLQALSGPGSAYRAVREGFNARAGALSAFLAKEGMAGDPESIEGQYGYFFQFFGGDYDAKFVRGERLLGPLTSFKPWPCAGHPQLFLTALTDLVRKGEVRPDLVKKIRITGCSALLPHQCEPLAIRSAPTQAIDAKVSIPFLIGKVLRHGTITIQDFSPSGLADRPAIELGERVEWRLDPGLQRDSNGYGIGIVEVEHEDGRCARAEAEYPLGHPSNPLSWDDVVSKFHRCVEASASNIGSAAAEIVDIVANLDQIPDVSPLLEKIL
jgi:2-methylcitrate dehydratase PrpD